MATTKKQTGAKNHDDHQVMDHELLMTMNAEMSFVDMIRTDKSLTKLLKLPDWFFHRLCKRKNEAKMNATERARFLCAYSTINASGLLGKIVEVHGDMSHRAHGNDRFLPWHRVYLLVLEHALHSVHPDVCIPYWDWTNKEHQNFPSWLNSYLPTVVTPSRTINVSRSPGTSADLGSIAANMSTVMSQTVYGNFRSSLEGVHGAVHVWVGGTMSSVPTAPADPIFWMHHANIDRLWWVWQNSPAGTGKNPPLPGSDAIMDPYPTTEPQTRNIISMGFNYV